MTFISLNAWLGIIREPLLQFVGDHAADTDVFCFQEIYKDAEGKDTKKRETPVDLNLYEHIAERLGNTHAGYFEPSILDYYGLATFVRNGLLVNETQRVSLYENPAWQPDGPDSGNHDRILQYLSVDTGAGPLGVANVHGLWKRGFDKGDIPERIEQSKRIGDFLQRRTEPFVMMGDFNLKPDTESVALIERIGVRNLIAEYGVTSTRTAYYEQEGKFADYAFVSPGVRVESFAVLPDQVSDHAPLMLRIAAR